MSSQAHVSSVEAIEAFRTSLILYMEKVRPLLDDATDDVVRMRNWVQSDQKSYWNGQLRKRRQALQNAEQALFASRIANLKEPSSADIAAVQRAKRQVAEAEEKLRVLRRWSLEYDRAVMPLIKTIDEVRGIVGTKLPEAAQHLSQLIQTLEAYSGVKPDRSFTQPILPSTTGGEGGSI